VADETHVTDHTRSRQGVPAVLGIDLGTSSVKVVIADVDGDVIGQSAGGYR
jgi:N-acetylglucosamine kinase-like BadF-type ATPase